jgi:predicted transglutaminase-like cysteine proteinase
MNGCAGKKKEPEIAVPAPERELTQGQKRIAAWHELIFEMHNAPEMKKLETVNNFFNRLEFVDDRILWRKEDYWATPQEMLLKNGGDCEDFATAKYFTLRQLEIPDDRMRLTYVKVVRLKKPHMVLSYYREPSADPLILDSLVKKIVPASERKDLVPIYSFNGQGLWLAKKKGSQQLGRSEQLNLWRDLQLRFIREAIASPFSQ